MVHFDNKLSMQFDYYYCSSMFISYMEIYTFLIYCFQDLSNGIIVINISTIKTRSSHSTIYKARVTLIIQSNKYLYQIQEKKIIEVQIRCSNF